MTRAHLDRIAAVDGEYNAFLHVANERALAAAAQVDRARADGSEPASALAGVPLALKDVFTTTDMPTTCGSKILEGWVSPYDATLTSRLRAAGIPVLGKTNMDEFAMGSSTGELGVRPDPQSVGHQPHPGRVRRRVGGGAGVVSGAAGDRHRHRRLDPPARRGHRDRRRRSPPTARCRDSAWWRARRRWIRAGRAGAPCSMRRCCTR